jgi:hypothetical protein
MSAMKAKHECHRPCSPPEQKEEGALLQNVFNFHAHTKSAYET